MPNILPYGLTERSTTLLFCAGHLHTYYKFIHRQGESIHKDSRH